MNILSEATTWNDVVDGYVDLTMPSLAAYSAEAAHAANLRADWTAVDIACGPGTLTELLAPRVRSVAGLDFAAAMLDRAQARLAHHDNVTLTHGDGQNLPFDDQTFDVAFSMFGLIFFPDRAAGFSEMLRVLKPNARGHVSSWVPFDESPAMRQMVGAIVALMPDAPPPPKGLNVETADQLEAEMAAAGFVDIEVRRLDHPFVVEDDIDTFWPRFVAGSAPILAMKRRMPPELWASREPAAKQAMADALAARGDWNMPALLGSGRRP